MGKKLKRKRSHHGPAETGPRPRAALPNGATVFISYAELRDHGISWCRVHLNRLIDEGRFPAPHRLSTNRIAWTLDDLERWKATRPLARGRTAQAEVSHG
jgi:predicted DNA-binding transcriptional regulator AlpA